MPKYRIYLLEVELGDDDAARLAALSAASRIRSCGGEIGGGAVKGPDGNLLDMSPGEIKSDQDLLNEAAELLLRGFGRPANGPLYPFPGVD